MWKFGMNAPIYYALEKWRLFILCLLSMTISSKFEGLLKIVFGGLNRGYACTHIKEQQQHGALN